MAFGGALLGPLGGCSSSDGGASGPAADAAVDAPDAAVADARDDGDVPDAGGKDANGAGGDGDACTFDRDCAAALRCECSEADGCACRTGARGTGRNGIDPCPGADGSNACASALCVEGPDGAGSFCSDECTTNADCTGQLPVCAEIALVGRVCVRTPPG
ncbi:MAG: hypothetical protein JWP97_1768 [Labilithrix sp.]|nr:hypothetical protein [Labilithrix sp.]